MFATSFTKELRTNYVPSSLDREHISALLIEPQKRLLELIDKISIMMRIIDELKQERDSLYDEIQDHTRLLTPFRCFPDDMLREIFLACLPDQHNAIMSCREAPLVLGLVCKRWRSLVYTTPSLWASVHIPYPTPMTLPPPITDDARANIAAAQEKLRKHQTALGNWLLRSGTCPLSISFLCSSPNSNDPTVFSIIQSYLDIILPFSHHWHDLDLYIPSGNLFNRIASMPVTSLPMLKHLRLSFPRNMSTEESLEWSSSSLLNLTSLHTLSISFIPFYPSIISSNFWGHLSYLTLNTTLSISPDRNAATIEEAYLILSRCRRLVHCSLVIYDNLDVISPYSGTISLPFLKSLSIVEACQSLSTLFECFTDLSELRGISYLTKLPPSNRRRSSLITLLARTNCRLHHLMTDLRSYTHADLSAIFALVPNLTHFSDQVPSASTSRNIRLPQSFSVGKVSLGLLTPFSNGEIYCPRLQSLTLKKACKLSDNDILTFLRQRMDASRCPGAVVEPLKEFRVALPYPAEIDIAAQLSEYVENGSLKLNITHTSSQSHYNYRSQIPPRIGLTNRIVPAIVQACQG